MGKAHRPQPRPIGPNGERHGDLAGFLPKSSRQNRRQKRSWHKGRK